MIDWDNAAKAKKNQDEYIERYIKKDKKRRRKKNNQTPDSMIEEFMKTNYWFW